jgi:hypothetical protein
VTELIKADREALIRVVKDRAKLAERDAHTRAKVLLAEVHDLMTAEFAANDALWNDLLLAQEAVAKLNAQIREQCAAMGIPAKYAPEIGMHWHSRSLQFADKERRAELQRLAEARLSALTETARVEIQRQALDVTERLIVGGLESEEAHRFIETLPTVEDLMPPLSLADLGVKGWQPPEDAAAQLVTPLTPADRKRRRILRAIEANPGASDRRIAEIADCDHKTVARYRRAGELPAEPEDEA